MLKKSTNKDILKDLLNQKASYSSGFLSIKYKKSISGEEKRFIIVPSVVSKKATERNKIKRRSRDILSKIRTKEKVNLAVFFKKGSENMNFGQMKDKLLEAVKNIK